MSGATPDPSEPAREPDAVARLQLTQALQRAKYAIAWERAWPHLARLLTVVGLFLVVSWAGLWLALPFCRARHRHSACSCCWRCGALFPLIRFRWPTREEALEPARPRHRHPPSPGDRAHRYAGDAGPGGAGAVAGSSASARWPRSSASAPACRRRGLPIHDPWALRALVVVMMVAAYVAAGDERAMRIAAAFDWNGVLAPANIRVDAWVTPPVYTGKPPIILSAANKEAAAPDSGPLPVPAGSTLIVRSSGGTHRRGGRRRRDRSRAGRAGAQGHQRAAFHDRRRRHRACPRACRPAAMEVHRHSRPRPDHFAGQGSGTSGPRLAADVLQDRGRLRRHRSARAFCAVRGRSKSGAGAAKGTAAPSRGRCSSAPQFPLVLPNARTRNGVGQTVKDLSEDPYAGADVTLTLTAKDEAGNEGKSEPFNMRLPERLFTKPLARALIEQRRILALDANQNVAGLCRARCADDRAGTVHAGSRPLSRPLQRRAAARGRAAPTMRMREVVASLWALAVTIEDGNITDVDKALRAAQEALKQALERGASDEEIKKLTDNLRAALDNFLRQLAEQLRNNPQQLARPLDPNTKMLSQQDLKNMIDRHGAAVALRRQGCGQATARAAAADAGKPADGAARPVRRQRHGAGAERARRHDPQAAAIARQDLQAGPGSRGATAMRGKQGDQSMGDLQQDQQGLRDRLEEVAAGELAKRGMGHGPARREGPARRARAAAGQQGQQGGDQGDGEDGLGAGRSRDGRRHRQARRGQRRRRGGFARPRAGSAAQGRPEPGRSDAAGRRRPDRATARAIAPAGSRAAPTAPIRSGGPLHGQRIHRRSAR